jgi:hypothetical protein
MLIIKRGTSLYEVSEYRDRIEVNVYRVYMFSANIGPEYVRTVTIPVTEYRRKGESK